MNLWIFISRPKKLTLHIDIYATKLTLSNRIQMSFFSQEMEWTVEWSGSKRREHGCEFNICSTWFSCEKIGWVSQFLYQRRFCVVVTLLPERVCHRLLWAIGDSLMPDGFLKCSQQSLQSRWRSHRFRCSDHILNPWGTFQTLLVLCTVLLVGCFQSADVLWQQIYKHGIRDPTQRAEALDHLASRLLCLWWFWAFVGVLHGCCLLPLANSAQSVSSRLGVHGRLFKLLLAVFGLVMCMVWTTKSREWMGGKQCQLHTMLRDLT